MSQSTRFGISRLMAMALGVLAITCSFVMAAPPSKPPGATVNAGTPAVHPDLVGSEGRGAVRFLGKFHVLVIHFPIALLVIAAMADVLWLAFDVSWFASSSKFCVLLGAPSALVAASLGWANSLSVNYTPALEQVLATHRLLGTVTAVWAVVALALLAHVHRTQSAVSIRVFRGLLYAGSVLVGMTAHLGGVLIYGTDYLTS